MRLRTEYGRRVTGQTMSEKTRLSGSVLAQPKGVDPTWREKIETAKRARDTATRARQGKPTSFRGAVGRRSS